MPANYETILYYSVYTPCRSLIGGRGFCACILIYNNGRDWEHIAHDLCHFLFVRYAVIPVFEETLYRFRFLRCFGGQVERRAISMAENNTKTIIYLTLDGEHITNDKDVAINPDKIICYIDATGYSEEEIEEMKGSIASADWNTFCAACECYTSDFTVTEVIDFIADMDEHFTLLPDVRTLEQLGEYVFDNYWDASKYEDIRYYIDFDYLGHDIVVAGEAAETSYGFVLLMW